MRAPRDDFHALHDAFGQLLERLAALAHQLDYEDRTAAAPDPKRHEQARKAGQLADDATALWDTFGDLLIAWDEADC
jgi:hypothetical protein